MKKIHTIGNIVKYKNNPYIVINEDFDCGCNIHVLGMVRLETYRPIVLKVKYAREEEITDYDEETLYEIKRGI
jgi:hypothetical protein